MHIYLSSYFELYFTWYVFFCKELVAKVHESVKGDMGRLFAVVHIGGEQRKVTTEDMVLINGFFPPQIGDKIRLEKVLYNI